MEASQATAAPIIPTDPREKYTSLGERPKVYPRPSSGRGRKQVPDVTATLAFGDPNKTLSQPPADLGPLRHVSAPYIPAGMTNEFGQEIHNEAELARQQLAASAVAGLPVVAKDNILLAGESLGRIVVKKTAFELEKWNTAHIHILTFLQQKGIASVVHKAWDDPFGTRDHIQKLKATLTLSTPVVFDVKTQIVRADMVSGFAQQDVMPLHVMALISLLVGTGLKRGIFVDAYNKWTEIQASTNALCSEKATYVLDKAVAGHAKHALSRYRIILLASPSPFICSMRAPAILSWISNITTRVQKIWDQHVKAELKAMVSETMQGVKEEEDEIPEDDTNAANDEYE